MFNEKIEVESIKENLIKKVTVTVFYKIENKTYENKVQRLKIRN